MSLPVQPALATESPVRSLGTLRPAGPELALPRGFSYAAFGHTGTPMSDGLPTPGGHRGQGVFRTRRPTELRLLRNHDDAVGRPGLGRDLPAYDRAATGSVTSSLGQLRAGLIESFLVLDGTQGNIGGAATPWATWLSCESTTAGLEAGLEKPHGYVFEVPADARGPVEPVPLTAMGRFRHGSATVDRRSGIVYLTELPGDQGAGFYRFLPHRPGRLQQGGRLQMLAVDGEPGLDVNDDPELGRTLACHWVTIPDPDPAEAGAVPSAVYLQGRRLGGAGFRELEEVTSQQGGLRIMVGEGRDLGSAQVWSYQPTGNHTGTLTLRQLFTRGAGTGVLRILTPRGRLVEVARAIGSDERGGAELTGACWSTTGLRLFVNLHDPGVTCLVEGPWHKLR